MVKSTLSSGLREIYLSQFGSFSLQVRLMTGAGEGFVSKGCSSVSLPPKENWAFGYKSELWCVDEFIGHMETSAGDSVSTARANQPLMEKLALLWQSPKPLFTHAHCWCAG